MKFTPKLETLPSAQRAVWSELGATPDLFILYGGTALALRLGHRTSVDFDFFSNAPFDPELLAETVPYLRNAERVQVAQNTLTCRVDRGGPVLISFFGGLELGFVSAPDQPHNLNLNVAAILDIAGTKVSIVQKRAEVKDYLDIDALLLEGIGLPDMLAAGRVVYGRRFNPLISLKALSYFDDLPNLPPETRARISTAAAAVDVANLPVLAASIPAKESPRQ